MALNLLKPLEIHTSDRQTFKRCRRKFEWGSTLRRNLVRIGPDQKAFFLGTGFHFALEDFHGYRRFDHPALAFAAYFEAQKPADLPDEADEALTLATGMLDYYVSDWLKEHPEPWETLWVDGKPQVEVEVAVDLTEMIFENLHDLHPAYRAIAEGYGTIDFDNFKTWLAEQWGADSISYVTTFDRVVIDKHERVFPEDYKTAAQFDELNLQTNPQAGAYDWSAYLFYTPLGFKVEGMVWQQFKKAVPELPKFVNVGKKNEGFSTAVSQSTTYRLYRKAVMEHYGTIPARYNEMLAILGNAQDERGDKFIRRDILRRNQQQREVEQEKIILEVLDMLDPDLPMYPNPTTDCKWDCPFKAPCLAMDDGSDVEHLLSSEYDQWQGYKDDWRKRVKYPDAGPVATK